MAVPRKPNYKTYTKDGLKYDRVELSLKYRLIRRKLEKEVEAELEEFIEYMKSQRRLIRRYQCGMGFALLIGLLKNEFLKKSTTLNGIARLN